MSVIIDGEKYYTRSELSKKLDEQILKRAESLFDKLKKNKIKKENYV